MTHSPRAFTTFNAYIRYHTEAGNPFSRECPITHLQIHIWLRENRFCPVLTIIDPCERDILTSPSFTFLKYIIIECALLHGQLVYRLAVIAQRAE